MSFKDILKKRAKKNNAPKMLREFTVYDVVKRPIQSEKSLKDMQHYNAYHFIVDMRANKIDIKKAISTLYALEVLQVTTNNLPHKGRMNRKTVRNPLKKAVVTLKKGDSISVS